MEAEDCDEEDTGGTSSSALAHAGVLSTEVREDPNEFVHEEPTRTVFI